MKCIIAQGNPGREYAATRHNIGWRCLDTFAAAQGCTFSMKSKFFAEIAEFYSHGEKIILAKPTTFYNETGKSVRALLDFYKLDPEDILVIHDDLALKFGRIRVRRRGRDAGNNGIKSINAHVGENYARIRLGIWNEQREQIPDADFVLAPFTALEQQHLNEITTATTSIIEHFTMGSLADESISLLH